MTDWDERYRAGDTPWDKGMAAPPLIELLEKRGREVFGGGVVCVPGCGLGHDVRALAREGIEAVGVDLSPTAVERARQIPVVGRERYELGDFLDLRWREGREYGAVWEHTCFCAIDPSMRAAYAAAVAGVLPEGGMLAGVFFLTPFDPGEGGAGPPFGTTIEELEAVFGGDFERVDGWVPETAYAGREGREWIGLFRKLAKRSVAGRP